MKAAPFVLLRPATIEEAVAAVAAGARVLAGGQSLMPMLAMRTVAAATLVDISGIESLGRIEWSADHVAIGANVRQRTVELDPRVAADVALLARAIPHIAHVTVRNQGTVVGSIAHADPAAEIPLVALVADATVVAVGPSGERLIAAGDFFTGRGTTALAPDELMTNVRFPLDPATGRGSGFAEVSRRDGDPAIVSAAAIVDMGTDGRIAAARIGLGNVAPTPVRVVSVEAALLGRRPGDADVTAMIADACAALEPPSDLHGTAAYRRHLATVLLRRVIAAALADAASGRARTERRPAADGDASTVVARTDLHPIATDPPDRHRVRASVNHVEIEAVVEAREMLVDLLREHLGLTGTHVGCEHGACGSCTVLVDGASARACLLPAARVDGRSVVTIEGLGAPEALSPLQQSCIDHHAFQCGFCTPGMLCVATELLAGNPRPTEHEVREAIAGNLCRCTGYAGIVAAVLAAGEAPCSG